MLENHALPPPVNDERCPLCVEREVCLPRLTSDHVRLRHFVAELFVADDEQDPQSEGHHERP